MLLSGGIDSATCLFLAKGPRTRAITFEYGGIAEREVRAAKDIAKAAGVSEHRLVRLPDLKEAGEIGTPVFEGLPPTYIPVRNAIFYSLAGGYAEEVGAGTVVGGHNRDDLRVFKDASPRFFLALQRALREGSRVLEMNHLKISRPLKSMSKRRVIRLAATLGVPLELTWSCHRDGEEHCWSCPGCESRRASFLGAGIPDPLMPRPLGKIS